MIPIPDEYFEVENCVYKLYYGDRYIIVKGKTLSGSIYLIEKGYANFISSWGGIDGKEWDDDTNLFYKKFYLYIHKHPKKQFTLEIVLESNNPYQLLLKEQELLDVSIKKAKCLNSNVEAYIPKFREKSQSYGWIDKETVDRFKDYLNNR